MPVAPVWRTSDRAMGSNSPNQRPRIDASVAELVAERDGQGRDDHVRMPPVLFRDSAVEGVMQRLGRRRPFAAHQVAHQDAVCRIEVTRHRVYCSM